jgi:hypothetical protein
LPNVNRLNSDKCQAYPTILSTLPLKPMKKYLLSVSVLTLSLIFTMSSAENAYAYSSASPNAPTEDAPENFRRPRGLLIRYQRNKRSISRQRNTQNDYNTSTGSTSTFDRRSDVLRKAQLERIKEDLESREYSNERRNTPHYWDRSNRSSPTTLRRINKAAKEGGIRHGQPVYRNYRQMKADELERKRVLQQEYRQQNRTKQSARFDAGSIDTIEGCTGISGRRYANCLYRLQNK